ncbi:MAG TPA: type II secretion system protein [Gemmatimonadales bacterium]|nr:type II secretion system protein [Gemmatimonadales bacterium]
MRRGFALIELVLVLGVAGVIATFAMPPLLGIRDRLAVDAVIYDLAGVHGRARLIAMVESRPVRLTVRPDSILIQVVAGTDTVMRWGGPGTASMAARVTGPVRTLWFAPSGVTYGVSNATWVVARGSTERKLVVSRWGRVRIE